VSPYSKDHIKFLKAIVKHHVKFLIIGGHAAIYHGVNRNTGDLDILIEPTKQNGERLLVALKSIKLEIPKIDAKEFEKPLVLAFGLEPDAVDILNFTPGLEFEEVYSNSIDYTYESVKVKIIDIHDLIANKSALNRKGDKALLDKYDTKVLKKILKKKGAT
jgi:predicted nucleotidyltransferase